MSVKDEYHNLKSHFLRILDAKFKCCDIPRNVLKKSTVLGHFGIGVVVNENTVLGENVFIAQNVTIGSKTGSKKAPVIEDNVKIHANACIIGDITIGRNSIIGAGAVVTKDVPPYSIIVGDNKILKYINEYKNENM